MNAPVFDWAEELPAAVTVCDAQGIIVSMNAAARAVFAADGGGALIGQSLYGCHPAQANAQIAEMLAGGGSNHYTIQKRGRRKIIHQMPWYRGGVLAGLVEISVPIPQEMAHFDRDTK